MTKRTIILNLDTEVGNKLYWVLKLIMDCYPFAITELEEE